MLLYEQALRESEQRAESLKLESMRLLKREENAEAERVLTLEAACQKMREDMQALERERDSERVLLEEELQTLRESAEAAAAERGKLRQETEEEKERGRVELERERVRADNEMQLREMERREGEREQEEQRAMWEERLQQARDHAMVCARKEAEDDAGRERDRVRETEREKAARERQEWEQARETEQERELEEWRLRLSAAEEEREQERQHECERRMAAEEERDAAIQDAARISDAHINLQLMCASMAKVIGELEGVVIGELEGCKLVGELEGVIERAKGIRRESDSCRQRLLAVEAQRKAAALQQERVCVCVFVHVCI